MDYRSIARIDRFSNHSSRDIYGTPVETAAPY